MTTFNLGHVVGAKGDKGDKGEKGDKGDSATITTDNTVTQNSPNPVKSSGIYTALTGKANNIHTHTKNQITDFPDIPDMSQVITKSSTSGLVKNDGSIDTTQYLSSLPSHTHTKSEITDFSHTHTKSEISDFSHSHSISDVTNLQTSLDGKVNTSDIANNLTTTTSGKVLDARQGKALADLIGDAITYINL